MAEQTIVTGTQRIVVMPPTGRVEVIGAIGPPGPIGPPGDNKASGFTFVQEAVPIPTAVGQTWFRTSTAEAFVWFDGFWIEYAPGPIPDIAHTYTHVQSTPASVWSIQHELPYNPNVTVIDSAQTQVEAQVVYSSSAIVTITLSAPTSGKAFLS